MLLPEDLIDFGLPKLNQVTSSTGSRYYQLMAGGMKMPSVTTLIGKYEDKRHLKKWIENQGSAEGADKVKSSAARIGTLVHSCNESYYTREKYSLEFHQEVITRHKLFTPILEKLNPIMIEAAVYWDGYQRDFFMGFAGSADLVGSVKKDLGQVFFTDKHRKNSYSGLPVGTVFVADYKNHLSTKTPEMMLGKYLQAAAYSLAIEQRTGGQIKPRHGLILATSKTLLNGFHINEKELNWFKFWFKKMVQCYFLDEKFDWKTFSDFSRGYSVVRNPDHYEGCDKEIKKWNKVPYEEDYLGIKLWTPKVSKKDLELIETPYLEFTKA